MRRYSAFGLAVALGACALQRSRVETISRTRGARVKVFAIATVAGEGPLRAQLPRKLIERLSAGGARAVDLTEADSVVAGSVLGLETASNPRVLEEIRRVTGGEVVVFLAAAPDWQMIDVQVVRTSSGDSILHAAVRPRGMTFVTSDEAASAVALALAPISPDSARLNGAALTDIDEIPEP